MQTSFNSCCSAGINYKQLFISCSWIKDTVHHLAWHCLCILLSIATRKVHFWQCCQFDTYCKDNFRLLLTKSIILPTPWTSSNYQSHFCLSDLSSSSVPLLPHPSSLVLAALSLPLGWTDLVMRAPCALPVCPVSHGAVGPSWTRARQPQPSLLIILITLPQISAGQAAGICPQLIKVPARYWGCQRQLPSERVCREWRYSNRYKSTVSNAWWWVPMWLISHILSSPTQARYDSTGVSSQELERNKVFQDPNVAIGWRAYLKEQEKHSSQVSGQKQTRLNCSSALGWFGRLWRQ